MNISPRTGNIDPGDLRIRIELYDESQSSKKSNLFILVIDEAMSNAPAFG